MYKRLYLALAGRSATLCVNDATGSMLHAGLRHLSAGTPAVPPRPYVCRPFERPSTGRWRGFPNPANVPASPCPVNPGGPFAGTLLVDACPPGLLRSFPRKEVMRMDDHSRSYGRSILAREVTSS